MKITTIPAEQAERLIPLLNDLHALHVLHQPERYKADPDEDALTSWLSSWLSGDNIVALGAESPTGGILGYAIYEIEERPDLPVVAGGKRAMLHHIAVSDTMRRMGIGQALVAEVRKAALEAGAKALRTTYAPFNEASAGLMQAMGLKPSVIVAEQLL